MFVDQQSTLKRSKSSVKQEDSLTFCVFFINNWLWKWLETYWCLNFKCFFLAQTNYYGLFMNFILQYLEIITSHVALQFV